MKEIQPSVDKWEILCKEISAAPGAFVVFGASGDLTARKLLVSIYRLYQQDLLDEKFYLLGCGRKSFSDDEFRQKAQQAINEKCDSPNTDLSKFLSKFYYVVGDYDDPQFYKRIKTKLADLDKRHLVNGHHIYYLSVPPTLYITIIRQLGSSGLSCSGKSDENEKIKLVIEKPFGRDYSSAVELSKIIHRCFDESQIYRIDHYLGKETVQNILIFRFANSIFEPVWNRNYIDNVQITIAEAVGVEHRAGYYDNSGALRDIFQNHMLQMVALVSMECPLSFGADHIRDERVKLLNSIRPFDTKRLDELCVRGQYAPGLFDGENVLGYTQEPNVRKDSQTETFVAAKLFIDNWRWQGVPFYLRTGKRLAQKISEIAITFRKVPYSTFSSVGLDEFPPNVLVFRIQPEEGISLSFQAKRPGSKVCMSTLDMNFSYKSIFKVEMPEAYQRLLLDCMLGDQTLFTRQDDVEASWRLLTPLLQNWEKGNGSLYKYPAGVESFPESDNLIESDKRKWRKLAGV